MCIVVGKDDQKTANYYLPFMFGIFLDNRYGIVMWLNSVGCNYMCCVIWYNFLVLYYCVVKVDIVSYSVVVWNRVINITIIL